MAAVKFYSIQEGSFAWRIEPSTWAWVLKRRGTGGEWVAVKYYGSPADAADALADGTTNDVEWDTTARENPRAHYLLPFWRLADDKDAN